LEVRPGCGRRAVRLRHSYRNPGLIQRFGSGLNLNIHFHTLALDGVFAEAGNGSLEFHPAPPPTDEEASIAAWVGCWRARIWVCPLRPGRPVGPRPLAPPSLPRNAPSTAPP